MVAFSVGLLLLLCRGEAPTITYETRATSLQKVLAEVGRQTGQTLTASEDIRENRVVVSLHDAPVQETLDHFALALGAEWVRAGSGIELRRTPASLARVEAEERADREKWVRQGYVTLTTVVAKRVLGESLVRGSSARRLMFPALRAAGVEALVSLKPNSRTVFSTHPTRLQRRLGGPAARLYQGYYGDWQAWRNSLPDGTYIRLDREQEPDPDGGPVILEATTSPNNIHLCLRVYNSRGFQVDKAEEDINDIYGHMPGTPDRALDVPYVESDSGKALRAALAETGQRDAALVALASQMLVDPANHDLLEGAPSDVVVQSAQALKSNAIVALCDAACRVGMWHKPVGLVTGVQGLVPNTKLEYENGWLTGRPRWGRSFLRPNYPRKLMASIASSALRDGSVTIEDFLSHGRFSYAGGIGDLLQDLLRYLSRQESTRPPLGGANHSVALFACLSPAQREKATQGLTIHLGALSKEQRDILQDRLFRGERIDWRDKNPLNPLLRASDMPIESEPTVAFATGLPRGGSITFHLIRQPTLAARFRNADGSVEYETSSSSAFLRLRDPAKDDGAAADYQVGKHYTLIVTYDFATLGLCEDTVRLDEFAPAGEWQSAETLSKEMQDEAARLLKARRNRGVFKPN